MKIGITNRLFLGMLAATTIVILCLWLIMQWSINSGFLRYVNTQDVQRLSLLGQILEANYAEQGSWDFLRDDQGSWTQILIRTLPPQLAGPEQIRQLERRLARQAEEEDNNRVSWAFELRVLLLDAGRNPIILPRGVPPQVETAELKHGDRVVGYLGLLPRPRTYDTQQLQFVQQQRLALTLVAATALLISALIALPLAGRLVRPIKTLAAAARRLSAGDYQTRVPVLASHELAQLAQDFNSLALTLEKNEQDRRQWVADISHELRTPLAVLRGEIEALQDGVRATTPEALNSLHAEAIHLGRLVEDLYQLSLSDLGTLTCHKHRLDPAEVLGDVIDLFRVQFRNKDIDLIVEDSSWPPVEVFADPERLHQLFSNLLKNTLRYTDSGGVAEIRIEASRNRVIIHLRDSAPGVPAAELDRIFNRLYRLETSRRRADGGAGLGLAICRSIVEAHQGSITAHLSPLGGLWIRIELPVAGKSA